MMKLKKMKAINIQLYKLIIKNLAIRLTISIKIHEEYNDNYIINSIKSSENNTFFDEHRLDNPFNEKITKNLND